MEARKVGSDASIPQRAAPFMGILVAESLHDGKISAYLSNESTEGLEAIEKDIRRCEPKLQAFQRLIGLPLEGPSWWVTDVLPAIDHELKRRIRPKPAGGGRIAELKAALNLLAVARRYTKMNQCGPNRWKGLCPLHNEKSPSFVVYEDTGKFRCYGCHAHGDVLDLLSTRGKNEL